jgi:hypothetical protein
VARAANANADSIPFFILDSLLSRLYVRSTFIIAPETPAEGFRSGAAERIERARSATVIRNTNHSHTGSAYEGRSTDDLDRAAVLAGVFEADLEGRAAEALDADRGPLDEGDAVAA